MSKNPKHYTAEMSLSEVIKDDYELLLVITRFGIPLGFGEKSIAQVCRMHQVHTETLLAVINTVSGKVSYDASPEEVIDKLDAESLINYLRNSHHYFLEYRLPLLRQHLEDALEEGQKDVAVVVLRFFDEYVCEVHKHMEFENNEVFPYVEATLRREVLNDNDFNIEMYSQQHDPVEAKITELKNILIKYYPDGKGYKLTTVLWDIFATEEDLALHNFVEDHLLIPIVRYVERARAKEKEKGISNRP